MLIYVRPIVRYFTHKIIIISINLIAHVFVFYDKSQPDAVSRMKSKYFLKSGGELYAILIFSLRASNIRIG
jgi:hypothetical protein